MSVGDRLANFEIGESFAAEDFGGLDREEPPEVLHEIDAVFPTLFVRWMFPITSAILQNSPFKAARDFINAAHTFRKVCTFKFGQICGRSEL